LYYIVEFTDFRMRSQLITSKITQIDIAVLFWKVDLDDLISNPHLIHP